MDAPSNPALVRSISEVLEVASDGELGPPMKRFLRDLLASTLIAGLERDDGALAAIETDDQQLFLALFTDLIELHMFEPGALWMAIGGSDAVRRVARGDYQGLVINPRGRSIELSQEDVAELFDVDPE